MKKLFLLFIIVLFATQITVHAQTPPCNTRQITVEMHDSRNDGWDGNGALRILVHGFERANGVKVPNSGDNKSTAFYYFEVEDGNAVEFLWIAGSAQRENAFAVYYSDNPPVVSFNPNQGSGWTNDGNVLFFYQYDSMNSIGAGTLLNFTAEVPDVIVGTTTAPTWREGNQIELPDVFVCGTDNHYWQISDNGDDGWTNFNPPSNVAIMEYNGKYMRHYATNGTGSDFSNVVRIRVLSATAREVTIEMWDDYTDGWNDDGAIIVEVNGTPLAENAKAVGEMSYYRFYVDTGDEVKFYWIEGLYQYENAFVVYYSDNPTVDFDPEGWENDGTALLYMLYGEMEYAKEGDLLGSFIVGYPIVGTIKGQTWRAGDVVAVDPPRVFDANIGEGWQFRREGTDWDLFYMPVLVDFDLSGISLRYFATNDNGTAYSNEVKVRVISQNAREITVEMWTSWDIDESWDPYWEGASLNIKVNGTDIDDAKLTPDNSEGCGDGEGCVGYYTFYAESGEVIEFFWKSGDDDYECAFAVYYSDDPPTADFNPYPNEGWTNDGKVLFYKQY